MSEPNVTPGHVRTPKQELTVQLIGLAALVVAGVIVSWQRKLSEPDHWRSQRMRWAKTTERMLARSAGWAWRHAERARVAYERERDAP